MNKTTLPEKKSKQAKSSTLDKQTTYHIDGRSFQTVEKPLFCVKQDRGSKHILDK